MKGFESFASVVALFFVEASTLFGVGEFSSVTLMAIIWTFVGSFLTISNALAASDDMTAGSVLIFLLKNSPYD
jgi:hypothetical protein